jgi:hypothetical protein
MIKNYDINWSRRSTTTPKTEQGFKALYEGARKKAIEMAVKRYFDGMEGARKLRLYGDYPKKRISNQQYQALVTLQKTELGKSLSNLLRKGDKIKVPQTSV